jgi:hypothetical protein
MACGGRRRGFRALTIPLHGMWTVKILAAADAIGLAEP